MTIGSRELAVRAVISLSLLAAGWMHLQLWKSGYREVALIGFAFLLQACLSFALAALILIGAPWTVQAAAGVLAAGALAAFALSRTFGIMGFVEHGWQPAPYAAMSVGVELITLGACLIFVPRQIGR